MLKSLILLPSVGYLSGINLFLKGLFVVLTKVVILMHLQPPLLYKMHSVYYTVSLMACCCEFFENHMYRQAFSAKLCEALNRPDRVQMR